MPAHKRPREAEDDLLPPQQNTTTEEHQQQNNNDVIAEDNTNTINDQLDDDDDVDDDDDEADSDYDSDDSDLDPSAYADEDGYILVDLSVVRKEVQCPICLGIIRKTRTVMDCLHRFCRECIDKAMRMGNNECPACRKHCASRRSLRDDPKFDGLIAALYPDIDKYEEQELAFQEDEVARNKLIQASIAQTMKRQADAAGRKRKRTSRGTAAVIVRRSKSHRRGSQRRRRRNSQSSEVQGSDEDEDGNEDGVQDSSADEPTAEVAPKRPKRWGGRLGQSSSAAATSDKGDDEDESEAIKDLTGLPSVFVNSDRLSWGKGGIRSHPRHGSSSGSASGGSVKSSRSSRNFKLIDHLKSPENNSEMNVVLVSLDKHLPILKEPYICCTQTLTVEQLCQYVAFKIGAEQDEIELRVATELNPELYDSNLIDDPNPLLIQLDPCLDCLRVLDDQETMEGLNPHVYFMGHVVLGYQRKSQSSALNEEKAASQ